MAEKSKVLFHSLSLFLYRIFCFQALRPFPLSLLYLSEGEEKFFYQLFALFAF
jgi:hypothetical protein